jgi:hypothetical protein
MLHALLFVSRAQRSMKRSVMMRCRPGTAAVRGGPGSAMHRFATARAASRPGHATASHAFAPLFTISNSPSRSRARIAASGLCLFAALTPVEGWAERRETLGCSAEHPFVRAYAARQAPSEAPCVPYAGRTPPGAPPWRFLAPGSALPSPALPPESVQRAPRSQVVVPGGRGPVPPGTTVTSRRRRTPHLAPHSGSSLEHALNEQGGEQSSIASPRSQ